MLEELDYALDQVGASEVRAMVLRADGPGFSFSGDIAPGLPCRSVSAETSSRNTLQPATGFSNYRCDVA
jgi:enoyl-CoA hydratase/carnithine racemase